MKRSLVVHHFSFCYVNNENRMKLCQELMYGAVADNCKEPCVVNEVYVITQ